MDALLDWEDELRDFEQAVELSDRLATTGPAFARPPPLFSAITSDVVFSQMLVPFAAATRSRRRVMVFCSPSSRKVPIFPICLSGAANLVE